jgi:23S rRNA pseudouridine1911/1915/1917 synthase
MSQVSRNKIQSWIGRGRVSINGASVLDPGHYVRIKDEILVDQESPVDDEPEPTPDASVEFSVLHEDEDLMVVNKPAGVVVHPGAGNRHGTLVNGLVHHCGGVLSSGSHRRRPGIVHRIDKDTSGVLVVAKNDRTHAELARQFELHSIRRKYICFCYAVPRFPRGKIETLLARDKNNRLKMAVTQGNGRNAVTIHRTLETFGTFAAKIQCELKTGRTHQIRVHMSHLGHSLIGDSLYRNKNYPLPRELADYVNHFPRQALHAYFLEFSHPKSGEAMCFEVDLPADMQELGEILKKSSQM